ncbi:MAG: serine hydrolase, partial [Oscillospiraceae bacterium]|nr:serine hydrolase [Oscillospiraceae bacterium]
MKRVMRKAAAFTLSAAMLLTASFSVSAEDKAVLSDTEWNAFLEKKIELNDPPGLAVAVVNGSETEYKNWGYGN